MAKNLHTASPEQDVVVPALSVYQVLSARFNLAPFEGIWRSLIGQPELSGSWIVWGQSFNGKTSFMMQLCSYLCGFEQVLYNPLEEGTGRTFQQALRRNGMQHVKGFKVAPAELYDDLVTRLSKRRSPRIVVIDSVQYWDMNYTMYKELKRHFPSKLFIWVSHAEGKLPEGRMANKIRYDANVKIRIEGYRAFIESRFAEGSPEQDFYTIWADGADKYWLKQII